MNSGLGPYIIDLPFELPFGIQLSQTVTTTWLIMLVLIGLSWWGTRNLQRIPSRKQLVFETLVGIINGLVKQTMGEKNAHFAPYIGTLILFLAFSNTAGLFGFRPPTADLNTTVALALITFSMIHGLAIYKKGIVEYVKGYFSPFFLMAPLNLIGELALPVSLSFRLFGNITGGMIIMMLVYGVFDFLSTSVLHLPIPILQVGIPAFLHLYFDVFAGVVQSFIFGMLTMVFVTIATD